MTTTKQKCVHFSFFGYHANILKPISASRREFSKLKINYSGILLNQPCFSIGHFEAQKR